MVDGCGTAITPSIILNEHCALNMQSPLLLRVGKELLWETLINFHVSTPSWLSWSKGRRHDITKVTAITKAYMIGLHANVQENHHHFSHTLAGIDAFPYTGSCLCVVEFCLYVVELIV